LEFDCAFFLTWHVHVKFFMSRVRATSLKNKYKINFMCMCHIIQKCTVKVQVDDSTGKIKNLDISRVNLKKKIRQKNKSNFFNFTRINNYLLCILFTSTLTPASKFVEIAVFCGKKGTSV
jgi:uncharacterized membrane protein